jgi:hypothetical protein
MKGSITWVILALSLSPSHAGAKSLCIQLDATADVLVLKDVAKGVKSASAYLADYNGGSSYSVRPMSGTVMLTSDNRLAAGFMEYGVGPNAFREIVMIHRVRCSPGADGKLGVLDFCNDIALRYPGETSTLSPGHIIDCIPEVALP